jgi:hypothetical protein
VNVRAETADTTPSPALSGETFAGTPSIVSASCNPDGTSTFTYVATGVAAGPYPGFFFERGTVTHGPTAVPGGGTVGAPILSFQANFVILSALGIVSGTKHSPPPPSVGAGNCLEIPEVTLVAFNYPITPTPATYTARLPNGCRDAGQTTIGLVYLQVRGQFVSRVFEESFVSSSGITCGTLNDDDD